MSIRDDLVSRVQVCEQFGICDGSIKNWIKRGVLPEAHIIIANKKYWTVEQIESVKKKLLHKQGSYLWV